MQSQAYAKLRHYKKRLVELQDSPAFGLAIRNISKEVRKIERELSMTPDFYTELVMFKKWLDKTEKAYTKEFNEWLDTANKSWDEFLKELEGFFK